MKNWKRKKSKENDEKTRYWHNKKGPATVMVVDDNSFGKSNALSLTGDDHVRSTYYIVRVFTPDNKISGDIVGSGSNNLKEAIKDAKEWMKNHPEGKGRGRTDPFV